MVQAWHFLGSTTLLRLGKLTLREDAWRLPAGGERGATRCCTWAPPWGSSPSWTPRTCSWSASSATSRARTPGSCRAAADSPAQRELREEAGYRAGRLTFLTRFFPSNAYLDETAYCYLGEDLAADPLASDDDEFFERRVVPFREAVAMALDDRITESVSKVALLAAALKLGLRN